MIRIEDILEKAGNYCDEGDINMLRRAYVFSARAHKDQVRRSGEPYLVHPLEVADILVSLRLDAITIATGLLHDVLEDTLTDADTLRATFGDDVVRLVEGVTKIGKIQFVSKEAAQAENFRKMLLAMVDDIRVILVKLADRLHNMRTLGYLPEAKRHRIATETLDIYAAIANRLGMGRIKGELEDLSFRHLHPVECANLEQRIEEKRRLSREFIDSVRGKLTAACQSHGLEVEIEGRVKRLYSIWQKMRRQNIRLEEVYDYLAFRVLADNLKDCYAVLGVVHGTWTPIPGRIKDYIAMPKPNLYQSIHTTLMSEVGHPFEVQIRTHAMNNIAEEGIAAHWRYKEGESSGADERTYAWLRSLVELGKDVKDPREFLDSLRLDLYPDEVYAFTPQGKVMSFPRGSTPIDFAYAIHTDLGHQCVGARINSKLVPLRTALRNGDIVEILRDKAHQPSRDWLKIVGTTRARSKIRQWLNNEARARAVEVGKTMLDRELRRLRLPVTIDEDDVGDILPGLGCSKLDDLYAGIGYGRIEARPVAVKLRPDTEPVEELPVEPSPPPPAGRSKDPTQGIEVRGHGDMLVTLARCCNPIPGDRIVGYVTRGRGVSVHAVDCRNVRHLLYDPERQIDVAWTGADVRTTYRVGLRVQTEDQPGMLAKISARISSQNTDIRHVEAKTFEDKKGVIRFTLEISDLAHLEAICRSVAEIHGVLNVSRIAD